MTEKIDLQSLSMNHFTESDAELYCNIFNINPDNIKELYLYDNKLTDISGVSIFKNIEELYLSNNNITDLSSLKNLINLKHLYISYLYLTDEKETVKILKTLTNLKELWCIKTFKTIKIKKELKEIYIND